MSPAEARIRKQSLMLAKRILKEDESGEWIYLVCGLVRRSRSETVDTTSPDQIRALYAFLLQNGVTEKVACDASGMDKLFAL